MKILLILLISLEIAELKTLLETKEIYWSDFKLNFKKSYKTREDENNRKEIFWKNLEKISHHNFEFRRGKSTFKMGINKFADMEFLEYSNMFKANESVKQRGSKFLETHIVVPDFKMIYMGTENENDNENEISEKSKLPTSFDLRKKGAVTSIKDQGTCGSCYAMSTIGSIETQLFFKTGKLVQLSEQEIMDCSGEFGTFGCEGGIAFRVYDYVKENGGISSAEDYPYEGKIGKCRKEEKKKIEINIDGYGFVDSYSDEALMEAIIKYGSVMISMDTDHESFMFYSSGIYYEENCTEEVNHGLLLVGFGSENGADYWIVKNSFGDKWGESGFLRVKRGREEDCSVNFLPLFPILRD